MRLHEKVKALEERLAIEEEGRADLVAYLMSPKFYEDNSVNVNDVLIRIREIKLAAEKVEL